MPEIFIDNFLKMSPQVPQYSQRNQNYLIAGANPVYYLDDNTQEQQLSPLAASIDWNQITGTVDGNIVNMIPSTEGTYKVYAITDTTKVYGITSSAVVDLGYPSGGPIVSSAGRLAIAGGILFVSLVVQVYKMSLPSGGWTTVNGAIFSGGVHYLEPFLDFVALANSYAGAVPFQLVQKIDVSSFTISAGLDLGAGFGILGMTNYNDKYLAIAAGRASTTGAFGYPQNYLFLWDGISSKQNYSMRIPGQYIGMKVVDSVLYVAVQVSNGKTCIYMLSGTRLKKVFTTQISTVKNVVALGSAVPCPLFDFKNYLGVQLNSTSDIFYPIMVYGNDEMGNLEFIYSYSANSNNRNFDQITVGFDGLIYANETISGGNSKVYFIPVPQNYLGNYQQIFYKSQWIPIKNLSAIDIYTDSLPVSITDAIDVIIDGKGEDIISGTSTTHLIQPGQTHSITSTNYLTVKRTRLDCLGFTGNQVRITLSTINSTWKPIIRAIGLITL